MTDLGINRKMLQRSRLSLQERGVVDFVRGTGQNTTQYLILDSVLAPEKGMDKKTVSLDKTNFRSGHNVHPIYQRYEQNNEKRPFIRFNGMTDQERLTLGKQGILRI